MTLIRWEPTQELNSLQSEVNRLFNAFFDAPVGGNGTSARRWVPAMDLAETEGHFVLRADLPGVREQDVSIELENGVLTLSGERKTEHEDRTKGHYRVERAFGTFSRSLTLPDGVDPDAVEASFEHGVLEVRIPKPERRRPRKVAISSAGGDAPAIEGDESAS